jgi:hypothetical protein
VGGNPKPDFNVLAGRDGPLGELRRFGGLVQIAVVRGDLRDLRDLTPDVPHRQGQPISLLLADPERMTPRRGESTALPVARTIRCSPPLKDSCGTSMMSGRVWVSTVRSAALAERAAYQAAAIAPPTAMSWPIPVIQSRTFGSACI